MPTILEGMGIEELIDVVESTLRQQLPAALERVADRWVLMDEQRAQLRGVVYEEITLEAPNPDAYYTMHIPSVVVDELRLDDIPYIAIIPDDSTPHPEDASQDHIDVRQNMISLHACAKSSMKEGAEFAGRRAMRLSEAIFVIISTDPALKRMLSGISNPMRVRVSQPFKFNPEGLDDQDWWWQMAGTQYSVKNLVKPPDRG